MEDSQALKKTTTDAEKLLAADSTRFHFARLSMQYYVMGRAAALHHQMPILGNLLHHAVEFALKAALTYQVDIDSMKTKLSHHLPKIWDKFLELNPHLDGTEHAGSIERLHGFEELRTISKDVIDVILYQDGHLVNWPFCL